MEEAIAQVYNDCRYLSGSFHRKPSFGAVVAYKDLVLPRLIQDLVRAEDDLSIHPWVIFSLLEAIVGKYRPTLTGIANPGRYEPIREMWLSWGREKGYI